MAQPPNCTDPGLAVRALVRSRGPLDCNRAAHLFIPLRRLDHFAAAGSKSDGAAPSSSSRPRSRALSLRHGQRNWRAASCQLVQAFNGNLCVAFNAHRAAALGSPQFTCSHRPRLSGQARAPEAFRAVALSLRCYLSTRACFLSFLCTPPSLSEHPQLWSELPSLQSPSPPLPQLWSSVKAVVQCLSLSIDGSCGFLSP